jgi:hypothetical protein
MWIGHCHLTLHVEVPGGRSGRLVGNPYLIVLHQSCPSSVHLTEYGADGSGAALRFTAVLALVAGLHNHGTAWAESALARKREPCPAAVDSCGTAPVVVRVPRHLAVDTGRSSV